MLPLIICTLAMVAVGVSVVFLVRERQAVRWERRAEEARVDRMVRMAQLRLNTLARNTFQEMLDVAREYEQQDRSVS